MAKGYLYDNGDELITREDVNEVPDSSTAHAGDVLELDSNKKPKWTAPESELPDPTSASEGDVLSLNSSKDPVWSAPSGGGGIPTIYAFLAGPGKISFFDSVIPDPTSPLTFEDIKSIGEFNYVLALSVAGVGAVYHGYAGDDDGNFLMGGIILVPDNSVLSLYLLNGTPLDTDTQFDLTPFKEIDYTGQQ